MPAYVARLLNLLDERGPPSGLDPELCRTFIDVAGSQVRAAYQGRHSTTVVLDHLLDVFEKLQHYQHPEPLLSHQTTSSISVIHSIMPDQSFIVDTLLLQLRTLGIGYIGGFNLVVGIRRDDQGRLIGVDGRSDHLESVIRVEIECTPDPTMVTAIEAIRGSLRLTQAMVADYLPMTELIDAANYRFTRLADRLPDKAVDLRETAEFLRWLLADNFVFMAAIRGDERFGFARSEISELWSDEDLSEWTGDASCFPVEVRKGSVESRVHRAGRKDEILVHFPSDGMGTAAPLQLQGLFTYRAVTQPSRHVPVLRQTLAHILQNQDSKPGSYRYKGIGNVFDSLPTEFLFTADADEIAAMIDLVLEAEQEQRVRTHVLQKPDTDVTFVLVAMPRGRWSDKLALEIQDALIATTGASYCDHGVFVGRYETMLVHFYLTGSRILDEDGLAILHDKVVDLATPWEARVFNAFVKRQGSERAEEMLLRYSQAFEDVYVQMSPPTQTARDIEMLEKLSDACPVLADYFVDRKNRCNLRIYQQNNILLSEILPVLDNFGLTITDQFADRVHARGAQMRTMDTFRLADRDEFKDPAQSDRVRRLLDAIEAVFTEKMSDDLLNTVLLAADIPWQGVDCIRAYHGYARQLGLVYQLVRVQDILLAQPALVRHIWDLFQARFDPDLDGDRTKAIAQADEHVVDTLRSVDDHDQYRMFRTLHSLVESTVRTNFYQTDRDPHYISFKVDCALVWNMPAPRLLYEVYVHHRDVEGIHLRGGPIARGGIRWSDRVDYRQEILGLATTQMVKNVLIVPEGAKGGFYIKTSGPEGSDRRARADALYEILIRGLLDITDNIVDGEVTHPARVVRYDGKDPYLVVAADKGTAHLSDTANRLATTADYWLGDAFASGGSNGYDHKKVGITARGAWVTTRRHFAEMGRDPDTESFTAVGIGDPSGDVFGNGVIESPHMRLLAAFNHLHIFLDPDPNPKTSFAERKRLFRAGKGWEHYNSKRISAGGGVFSRRTKSIKLSPEVRQMLGVLSDELPAEAVVRLILRLDVDLLWNGGIGTYVKASNESHRDANDNANDGVRVDADELRCRIVAEGGNLGFTQAARIEYALAGGRINTDAIDNSAGVDMSDHEVNLKILLNPLVQSGKLTVDARNTLLEELTEVVAEQVLKDSDLHGRQLSLDWLRSGRDPLFYSRAIQWVCRTHGASRAALCLPSDDDLLRRRATRQRVSRPELAVLGAHVKRHVFQSLMLAESDVIPGFPAKVYNYFPKRIQDEFPKSIDSHMLYQSIGMTMVTAEIVGESGCTLFPMIMELTAAPAEKIARAWYQAMVLAGAEQIRRELDACDASLDARYRAWLHVTDSVGGLIAFALSPGEDGLDKDDPARVKEALGSIPRLRGAAHQKQLRLIADQLVSRDIPANLAQRIAALAKLTIAREIARGHTGKGRLSHDIIGYVAIGEATYILPALRRIRARNTQGSWDPVALGILRNRYFQLMRELVTAIPIGPEARLGVNRIARRLVRRGPLGALQMEIEEVLGDQPDVSKLLVAEERIRARLPAIRAAAVESKSSNGRKSEKRKANGRQTGRKRRARH